MYVYRGQMHLQNKKGKATATWLLINTLKETCAETQLGSR